MNELARRLLRPVYAGYYRVVYGRSFPGAARLLRSVEVLEQVVGRKDTPLSQGVWDDRYRGGRWLFMRELHELPRYAAVAAVVHQLAPNGAVLDVACGEGLLVDQLRRHGAGRYFGIDIAEVAVAMAAGRADDQTTFAAVDAETFATDERFDVVVFNECICYFRDALGTVRRYESLLSPGGRFVTSTFRTPRHDAIMRRLTRRYRIVEEFSLANRNGTSVIRILTRPT